MAGGGSHGYGTDKTSQIVLISVPEGSVTRLKSTAWQSPTLGGFSRDGKFLLYSVEREFERRRP